MAVSDEVLEKIDQSIKLGDYPAAKKRLDKIAISKTPERLVTRLSDLLIRTGMFKENSKLLYPHIYNQTQIPSPKIEAHYALTLQQIGAYREANRIFENFDFSKAAEAHFYYAITLFAKWEYKKAIEHLIQYLESKEITPYQRLVGESNLVQAYLETDQFEEAENHLKKIESEINKSEFVLVQANIFQLRAQLLYSRGQYKEALRFLDSSQKLLKTFANHYQLTAYFWKVNCEFAMNPQKPGAVKAFQELRKKSVSLGRWSLVRQCDFYRSVIEQNKELFLKVYFGTPFPAYRDSMISHFGEKVEIPEFYDWNATDKSAKENQILDAKIGKDLASGGELKRGQRTHRLLQTLASDFYINFKLETLSSYIFPDEHYNPVTSYKRAFSAVDKLQTWFKENNIPMQVRFKNDGYRLYFEKPYILRVRLTYDDTGDIGIKSELENLMAQDQLYSAKELSEILKVPLRTTYRKINDLLANNKLTREKFGQEVKYRLKKDVSN